MPTRSPKPETKSAIATNGDFATVSFAVPPSGSSLCIWRASLSKKPNRRSKTVAGRLGCRRANIGLKSGAGYSIGPSRRSGDLREFVFSGRSPTSKRHCLGFSGIRPKLAKFFLNGTLRTGKFRTGQRLDSRTRRAMQVRRRRQIQIPLPRLRRISHLHEGGRVGFVEAVCQDPLGVSPVTAARGDMLHPARRHMLRSGDLLCRSGFDPFRDPFQRIAPPDTRGQGVQGFRRLDPLDLSAEPPKPPQVPSGVRFSQYPGFRLLWATATIRMWSGSIV